MTEEARCRHVPYRCSWCTYGSAETILRDAVEQTHFRHDLMDTGFDRGMRVRRARLRDGPQIQRHDRDAVGNCSTYLRELLTP
jgi:hypothetical protein